MKRAYIYVSRRPPFCKPPPRISPPPTPRIKKPDSLGEHNPQAKVPVLVDHASGMTVPESDTILRFIVDKYAECVLCIYAGCCPFLCSIGDNASHLLTPSNKQQNRKGPAYRPSSLEARTKSDLICRFHDMYITTIQGCMYKAAPPFGVFDNREDALKELKRQMAVMEDLADAEGGWVRACVRAWDDMSHRIVSDLEMKGRRTGPAPSQPCIIRSHTLSPCTIHHNTPHHNTGPFLTGKEKSMADATLFCTGVFLEQILPNHFGWTYQEVFGAWWRGDRMIDWLVGWLVGWLID